MQHDGKMSIYPGLQADLASWSKVILRVFIERAGMPSVEVLCWAREHRQKAGLACVPQVHGPPSNELHFCSRG